MVDALGYVTRLLEAVVGWLNKILDAIPFSAAWILAVFAMYCAFRFLIKPIAGGRAIGGSDGVRKSKAVDASDDLE